MYPAQPLFGTVSTSLESSSGYELLMVLAVLLLRLTTPPPVTDWPAGQSASVPVWVLLRASFWALNTYCSATGPAGPVAPVAPGAPLEPFVPFVPGSPCGPVAPC